MSAHKCMPCLRTRHFSGSSLALRLCARQALESMLACLMGCRKREVPSNVDVCAVALESFGSCIQAHDQIQRVKHVNGIVFNRKDERFKHPFGFCLSRPAICLRASAEGQVGHYGAGKCTFYASAKRHSRPHRFFVCYVLLKTIKYGSNARCRKSSRGCSGDGFQGVERDWQRRN